MDFFLNSKSFCSGGGGCQAVVDSFNPKIQNAFHDKSGRHRETPVQMPNKNHNKTFLSLKARLRHWLSSHVA